MQSRVLSHGGGFCFKEDEEEDMEGETRLLSFNGGFRPREQLNIENGQSKLCARGHWRPAEDEKLRELVSLYGPQNWNLIAEKLDGRSGKSCRLRWFNQLDPRINRRPFTEEEEERLLAAHHVYGNKWAMIARMFPGRSDNAVKNHWHVIMARQCREQSKAYRRRRSASSPVTHSQHTLCMMSPNSLEEQTHTQTYAHVMSACEHDMHAYMDDSEKERIGQKMSREHLFGGFNGDEHAGERTLSSMDGFQNSRSAGQGRRVLAGGTLVSMPLLNSTHHGREGGLCKSSCEASNANAAREIHFTDVGNTTESYFHHVVLPKYTGSGDKSISSDGAQFSSGSNVASASGCSNNHANDSCWVRQEVATDCPPPHSPNREQVKRSSTNYQLPQIVHRPNMDAAKILSANHQLPDQHDEDSAQAANPTSSRLPHWLAHSKAQRYGDCDKEGRESITGASLRNACQQEELLRAGFHAASPSEESVVDTSILRAHCIGVGSQFSRASSHDLHTIYSYAHLPLQLGCIEAGSDMKKVKGSPMHPQSLSQDDMGSHTRSCISDGAGSNAHSHYHEGALAPGMHASSKSQECGGVASHTGSPNMSCASNLSSEVGMYTAQEQYPASTRHHPLPVLIDFLGVGVES